MSVSGATAGVGAAAGARGAVFVTVFRGAGLAASAIASRLAKANATAVFMILQV